MDKMREEFEAWAKPLPLANLNRHLDGYENQTINNHWSTWQASRQALVVELPKGDFAAWVSGDMIDGYKAAIADVVGLLDAAGVNHK